MKIEIFMKSGNILKCTGVKDWSLKYNNEQITSLTIEYKKLRLPCKKLIIQSIDLKQIEAIVKG